MNTTQAAESIRHGGVIVFPTDTAYALGADFQNEDAINNILSIKGRTDKKFTVIASSLAQVQQFFSLDQRAEEIVQSHWPGPLSIVVNDRFSVRVPDNPIARSIAEEAGTPIIATSANKSGEGETYSCAQAKEALATDAVDVWVDGGELMKKAPSTIIQVNTDGVHILRQGPISL
jgi:L-threonylcarbamoyladenylate synthase